MPNLKKVLILSVSIFVIEFLLTLLSIQMIPPIADYMPQIINSFGLLGLFVGITLMVLAGFFIYEQKKVKLWQGRNLSERLFAILLYSFIVLFVVSYALNYSVPGIFVILLKGLGINLAVVSAVIILTSKYLNFPRV